MDPKEQRMRDVESQYPDQWVLIQVTREDRYRRVSYGVVLGHGDDPDHEELVKQEIAFGRANPKAQTFLSGMAGSSQRAWV